MGALATAGGPSGAVSGGAAGGEEVAPVPPACGAIGSLRSPLWQFTASAPGNIAPGDVSCGIAAVATTTATHGKRKRSELSAQVPLDESSACRAKLVKVEDGCGLHEVDPKSAEAVSCDSSQEHVRQEHVSISSSDQHVSHALVAPQLTHEQPDARVDALAASEHNTHADLWLFGAHDQSLFEEYNGDFLPF